MMTSPAPRRGLFPSFACRATGQGVSLWIVARIDTLLGVSAWTSRDCAFNSAGSVMVGADIAAPHCATNERNPLDPAWFTASEVVMRSAGKSHAEWGYHAPTSGVLPAIRIAVVATVIGAIGGAAVVVSLIERPGANEDNTSSIAAHALVTGAPVIPASPSSLTTATLAHGPGQPKPGPSVGLLASPAA